MRPARNPPAGGLPTRGRHDARCPMALHRPENPDSGLPSDPPGRRTGPKPNHRSGVPAPPTRSIAPAVAGHPLRSDQRDPPRRLCAACHHQKISDQRLFQSGWMQSATACHGRQGSWTASAMVGSSRTCPHGAQHQRRVLAQPAGQQRKPLSPNVAPNTKAPEVHASGAFCVSGSAADR